MQPLMHHYSVSQQNKKLYIFLVHIFFYQKVFLFCGKKNEDVKSGDVQNGNKVRSEKNGRSGTA